MNLRERIDQKQKELDKKQKARIGQGLKLGYASYFDGYTTYRVKTKNGKSKILRIYTAPYMEHEMTEAEWKRQKLIFAALTVFYAAAFLGAAFSGSGSSRWAAVSALGSASLAFMVLLTANMLRYLCAKRKMTIWQQRSTHRTVRNFSFFTWILLAATAVCDFVYLLFISSEGAWRELLTAALYAAGAAAVFVIWRIEVRTDYAETENEPDIPPLAEMIIPAPRIK